jgi:hypothetical protein
MEISCSRCHQTVEEGTSYCPFCGLPQLVFTAEGSSGQGQAERWNEAVRDAGSIDWKAAIRYSLMLAMPAGLLCSMLSPAGILGLLFMAGAGAWAVLLYMRGQRPPWITIGAGARIGLVTGVLGAWAAAAMTGLTLFAMRFWFHEGKIFDDYWQKLVGQQMSQQWASMGIDAQTVEVTRTWLLSPEGRAGWVLGALAVLMAALLLFAVAGGALGARLLARTRRPQV